MQDFGRDFPQENINAIIGTLNYAVDSYVQAAE